MMGKRPIPKNVKNRPMVVEVVRKFERCVGDARNLFSFDTQCALVAGYVMDFMCKQAAGGRATADTYVAVYEEVLKAIYLDEESLP